METPSYGRNGRGADRPFPFVRVCTGMIRDVGN